MEGHVDSTGNRLGHELDFERAWPFLARQITGMLVQRGIPQCLRDDIIQETGLRLYRMWDEIDESRSVVGLARTIALNIARDNFRRDSRQTFVDSVPETAAPYDVERAGLARVELRRLGRALDRLSSSERAILLATIDDRPNRRDASPGAIKMMRMRARKKLRAALERSAIFVPVPRSLWEARFRLFSRDDLGRWEHGIAIGIAGLVATATLSGPLIDIPKAFGQGSADTPSAADLFAETTGQTATEAARTLIGARGQHRTTAAAGEAGSRSGHLSASAPMPAGDGYAAAGLEVIVPGGLPGSEEGANGECIPGVQGCRTGHQPRVRAWLEVSLLKGHVRENVGFDSRDVRTTKRPQ